MKESLITSSMGKIIGRDTELRTYGIELHDCDYRMPFGSSDTP